MGVKTNHYLTKEKFFIDNEGMRWVPKDCDNKEDLPKIGLWLKTISCEITSLDCLRNFLKDNLFPDPEDIEEIIKNFQSKSSKLTLKRIVVDSYGLGFIFENKITGYVKNYGMGYIDTHNDQAAFKTISDAQEILISRGKNIIKVTGDNRIIRITGPEHYDIGSMDETLS